MVLATAPAGVTSLFLYGSGLAGDGASVTWLEAAFAAPQTFATLAVDAAGAPQAGPTRMPGNELRFGASVAVEPDGTTLLAFDDDRTGTSEVLGHRVLPDGDVGGASPQAYCAPSASGAGCLAGISASGSPSAASLQPFVILGHRPAAR